MELFTTLLRLADNNLILGHRLSEWCGHAPVLEEDIALANIALDLIGQSRMLYDYAGKIEGKGRDEDALCFLRDVGDYKNTLLTEQPNGDFAFTIIRQMLYAHFALLLNQGLCHSKDETLKAIAQKSVKELNYHVRHCSEWVIRLGDGTDISHAKMQAALEDVWSYWGELFEQDEADFTLIKHEILPDVQGFKGEWLKRVSAVFSEATLQQPAEGWSQTGGRNGNHSEHLGFILAELQFLQRTYPGAKW